ncbi:MAG: substrate-binding domain-containing protein [Gemmatimonadota bacterium]|jgi:molybdate-binding protein/DNA-binding XRE family transcriptional regulator
MTEPTLVNDVRRHRERLGLSQQELADLVGVSRQAVVGIEGGRQVPATTLSLRLAQALRCGVHDLFRLSTGTGLTARLAQPVSATSGAATAGTGAGGSAGIAAGARVAVGEVDGSWVAHGLPADGTVTADAIVTATVSERTALLEPLTDPGLLRGNVLVTGCAPILGMLAQRVGSRFADARATWIPTGSTRSLELLESKLIHVAGVHLSGAGAGEDHAPLIRELFPGEPMLIVNLTRWREGFVVPAGNPMGIRGGEDLLRPGLRFARREEGAGAHRLVAGLLSSAGASGAELAGPEAAGHAEVAQLVRSGAADVGVAIEGVALASGLDFVALTEERFDLVLPASLARTGPVSRLIETLDDPAFRAEMAHVPGYDTDLSGQVTTLEAA